MKNPAWDNLESRNDIRKTAFLLFRKLGYKSTSYSMIAEESGQGRPLVQYYYPKKEEIAIEFVEEVLRAIISIADSRLSEIPALQTFQIGQLYYAFLLWDDDMCRFTREVLENRAISSRLVEVNADRSLPHIAPDTNAEQVRNASIKATGGMYELLYIHLQRATPYPPSEYALQNTAAFLSQTTSESYENIYRNLAENALTEEQVEQLCQDVFNILF